MYWLGNTPKIAMMHYLQVRDSDYEAATKGEPSFPIVPPAVSAPAAYARETEIRNPSWERDTKSDTKSDTVHRRPGSPRFAYVGAKPFAV